MILQHHFKQ